MTRFAVLLLVALTPFWPAYARDNGQWGHVDPVTRQWIKSLTNKQNIPCCDTADGYDAEWDTEGDHYRVRIDGQWHNVPPDAVLDIPNRLGVPKVWYIKIGNEITIRCFLPGGGV